MAKLNVGILLFDDVEVLDFAGPFEVFSRTRLQPGVESRRSDDSAPFHVFTVAPQPEPIRATGGLIVQPTFSFTNVPRIDILIVPGGFGTRPLLQDAAVIDWVRARSAVAQRTLSVCTGALLLAKAGLLASHKATTHWGALDLLHTIDPTIEVRRDVRFVDDGYQTSAGVSAGIDMSLHVVERLFGAAVADDTARYIEFVR